MGRHKIFKKAQTHAQGLGLQLLESHGSNGVLAISTELYFRFLFTCTSNGGA